MADSRSEQSGRRVIVGLTGRVGSCVTAFLLKKQGFDVIGMSIVTNVSDNFADPAFFPKCHIEDLDKIKDFCNSLKIPFYATDAKSRFEGDVIDPLLANKMSGSANASCFNCTEMRIKVMYEKMKKLKADFIATGHFCKVHKNVDTNEYFVHSNNDPDSDQSYLLSNISSNYLKHLLLPLGELRKVEIDKIAHKFNLKLASNRNFTTFCFKEKSSYQYYIKKRVPKSLMKEGQILNVDTENYHGDHSGMLNHYITESNLEFKGLMPNDTETEVVGYDFEKSILYIGKKDNLTFSGTQLIYLSLNSSMDKKKPIECFMKNKYSTDMMRCNLFFKNNQTAVIELDQDIYPVIGGEVFVLFDRDTRNAKVIGRGVVGKRGKFKPVDRVEEFRKKTSEEDEFSNIFKF